MAMELAQLQSASELPVVQLVPEVTLQLQDTHNKVSELAADKQQVGDWAEVGSP